ncbi:MAG: iron-sulfur cluster assembly protein [Crenarchaeota archaeon]|nr:iron-sulfur cluster assembly protein [Thermoproteota archaeon]MCR8454256.1 iron-sulfur cluster assembly protein [Thermoproteota archaeon]MCR8454768.1 iron-sulfur cluster assembly protein [Thermoproteota archaeon]MCR8462660.1 iron-sulfur cluster assembly protein [Thermoproteota archaeon]MCR8470279.1 iron-sulfur cluster assembly protein [Thermoproteota archaeon]
MVELVKQKIMETLKRVKDPEIGINVVDLGLIKEVTVDEEHKKIEIRWIPTSPLCPLVIPIAAAMRYAIMNVFEIGNWDLRILIDESEPMASYWNAQLLDASFLDKVISRLQETSQIKLFIS